ncbi:LOW QUALITY PROTEIN: FH protein interacting protein FIP2-like [Acropora millepora]|uniref:LOW QUALITY PROTEIN: FH protein interacting protein FIP2-like n=1 Tax=Acropora millepora TaxID=45264 RepID=UPI0010FC8B2F|nr:LOW QUALITY PROTEIN: FH protein interacting protein FIP2-like [Acropora millepora]
MSENGTWHNEIHHKLTDLVGCFDRREQELAQLSQKLASDREAFEQEMKSKRQEHDKIVEEQYKDLEETRLKVENEKKRMHEVQEFQSSPVHLNVGGHRFTTSLQTLRRDQESMLATMFSGRHKLLKEPDGCYFVDRDGTHFRHILNYLRDGFHAEMFPQDELSLRQIINEAQYYQLNGLVSGIETVLDPPPPAPDFTQNEINDMLATLTRQTTSTLNPPPGLDLGTGRHKIADFVFHNMTKTNLDFHGKNLSGLSFAHTTFAHNVSFVDTCLVNTSFYGCEFASHVVVDFTDADLSGADFRQCRCIQGGPNAFNGLGGGPVGAGGGFMFGSSCSSFAHLIKTGHVKFTGAKHIGTKFEQHIREIINF